MSKESIVVVVRQKCQKVADHIACQITMSPEDKEKLVDILEDLFLEGQVYFD